MVRWVPLVGAVAWALGFVPEQNTATPATGLILGRVVDATNGAAVPDVVVTLEPASGDSKEILTTADGEFVFRQLSRGAYRLTTAKNGYVAGQLGAGRPAGPGHPLEITDGQRIGDVSVRIWKLAAVEGTVLDEAAEPMAGVAVRAWRRTIVAGRATFDRPGPEFRTDDRGVYRISDLVPDDYVVGIASTQSTVLTSIMEARNADPSSPMARAVGAAAIPRSLPGTTTAIQSGTFVRAMGMGRPIDPPAVDGATSFAYASTFHPSSESMAGAEIVRLESGDERTGIDIRLKPMATVSLSGRLTGPADAIAYLPVALMPATVDEQFVDLPAATTISDVTGAFTFPDVPRGEYFVRVLRVPRLEDVARTTRTVETAGATTTFVSMSEPEGVSPDPTWWAIAPVSVADRAIGDLVVPVAAGTRLRGRVSFEGSAERHGAGRWLSVQPVDGRRVGTGSGALSAWVSATGEFLTPELPPGRYVIRSPARGRWLLKSATVNGRDVADDGIVVGASPLPEILVTLSDSLSGVSGLVRTGPGGADGDASVVVFSIDRRHWTDYGEAPRRLQLVRTDARGYFVVAGLPAGMYAVAALPATSTRDWPDPSFLARIMADATRVDLTSGGKATLELRRLTVR